MADITKITATIKTADVAEAHPADGTCYLGIGGREFVLDIAGASDMQQGATDVYVFGEDGNVVEAEWNDPRKPQLVTADLDRYPVYIRFTGGDGWCIERAWVTVEPGGHEFDNYDLEGVADNRRIWLRADYGQVLHLTRSAGTPDPGAGGGGSGAGPRIVWGNVDKDGNVQSGSGDFLVEKQGGGRYKITFQRPFRSVPSATSNLTDDGWNLRDNSHIAVQDSSYIVVTTGDQAGGLNDRPFSFQVIGGASAQQPATIQANSVY